MYDQIERKLIRTKPSALIRWTNFSGLMNCIALAGKDMRISLNAGRKREKRYSDMKPEQALKIIDGIEEVRGNLPEDGLLVDEALIGAKDALRKQVSKKPIWSYAYPDWLRERFKRKDPLLGDEKTYCCPACKNSVMPFAFAKCVNGAVYGDQYCKNCGQHISWENIGGAGGQ